MAKLIIYHGDVLDREADLGETTVRVGRGDDNEIVLTDPTKGVSRLHAELRFEQGHYVVVDLKSQNGVWVEGRRVPTATLQVKVPVVLGPYRLLLKDERPASVSPGDATVVLRAGTDPASAATVMLKRPLPGELPPAAPAVAPASASQAVPVPEAKPVAAAPKPVPVPPPAPVPKAEPPAPPVPTPKPAPPPEVKPTPPPAEVPKPVAKVEPPGPASAAPKPTAKPAAPRRAAGKSLWYVAAAVVVLAAGVGGAFLTPVGRRWVGLSEKAPVQIASSASAPAASAPVVPAPPAPPTAVTPPVATPSPAPAPAKPPVRPPVEKPAAVRPPAPRPAPVATSTAPAAQTRPTPPPPRPVTPAPTSKPTPAPPPPPPQNPATLFEQGRNASIDGDFLRAIGLFEQLLKIAPTHPGAAEQLTNARNGARGKAGSAIVSGEGAQQKRDYLGAMKQYELALQLDPQSTLASDRILRLKAQMLGEGEAAFNDAQTLYSMGRSEKSKQDAIANYQRALDLLPADHASVKTIRERLLELKGGD